jgi:LPS sulfotransferase NodH
MTKQELKSSLINKLIRSMTNKPKAKRKVTKRVKVARKIVKPKSVYTVRLSKKKLTHILSVSVALSNKSGDMFRVTKASNNIFTLSNIRTGTDIIYYKKGSIFREGMVTLNAAIDQTADSYKPLAPMKI